MKTAVTLIDLNNASQDAFVAAIGFAFEGSPWVAAEAWPRRPFRDRDSLHQAMCAIVRQAPSARQMALIRAHPDLVGRAALAGTLTTSSSQEQASAGLDRLSPEEVAAFTRLNAAYWQKFGFPFIICVRQNRKEAILASFDVRLQHTPDQEITTALDEIGKIAYLRLIDAVTDERSTRQ